MAVSMETQRLISVSLGKIAQSRGQRGGINLHKNLLVATVLHKARTAYMMESYSYQQHVHRQKLLEQYQCQQQQNLQTQVQKIQPTPVDESNKGEVCPVSCDSNLGHTATTPANHEQSRSVVSSESSVAVAVRESLPGQDKEVLLHDKENSPPLVEGLHNSMENTPALAVKSPVSHDCHLVAATQLSQEAHIASSEHIPCKQQTLTSGSTTCNILKRRRINPSGPTQDNECPANKVARVNQDTTLHTEYSNVSISGTETSHTSSDCHQISNLVSIFNSGFSGLCVTSSSDFHTSSYQSDFDMSSLQSQCRKIPTKAG